jgi:hypothetical protein
VTGLIFKKDGEHPSYQIKQWSHQKQVDAMKAVLEPKNTIDLSSNEGPSSAATKKDKGGKKIKSMLRDVFASCKYNATQTYELQKDVNKLLLKANISASHLDPPSTFPFSLTPHLVRPKMKSMNQVMMSLSVLSCTRLRVLSRKSLRTPTKPHGKDAASDEAEGTGEEEETEDSWTNE